MLPNLEKIARMEAFGTPHKEIAGVMNLSEGRISQIMETVDYKKVYSELEGEINEKNQTLNDAWDKTEATALNILLKTLEWNSDPELALKAAIMANKAQRRGNANQPLEGKLGVRAVIHLQATFIERIQANVTNNLILQKELPQKDTDVMTPGQVEDKFITQVEDLLPDIPAGSLAVA